MQLSYSDDSSSLPLLREKWLRHMMVLLSCDTATREASALASSTKVGFLEPKVNKFRRRWPYSQWGTDTAHPLWAKKVVSAHHGTVVAGLCVALCSPATLAVSAWRSSSRPCGQSIIHTLALCSHRHYPDSRPPRPHQSGNDNEGMVDSPSPRCIKLPVYGGGSLRSSSAVRADHLRRRAFRTGRKSVSAAPTASRTTRSAHLRMQSASIGAPARASGLVLRSPSQEQQEGQGELRARVRGQLVPDLRE